MKKSKYTSIFLLSLIMIIPMLNVSIAAPPSYIGVSEGEVYTWGANINKNGIISLKDDFVIAKDEIKTFLEDPAGLEAWLKSLIPSAWLSLNFTSFVDAYLVNITDDVFSPDSIMTSGWTEDLLNDTIISVIENFTDVFTQGNMPAGFMDLNISAFLNALVDNLPDGFLPAGWQSNLNVSGLIGAILENISTTIGDFFVDRGILPFGMPDGWLDMTLTEIYEAFVDLLSEGLDPDAAALMEMLIGGWSYSSITLPSGAMPTSFYLLVLLSDSSLIEALDEMFTIISPEFAAYNVTELIANYTATIPPGLDNISISALLSNMTGGMLSNMTGGMPISIKQIINMSMLSGMAMGLSGFETDSSMDVLITQFVEFVNNVTFETGGPWEMFESYINGFESAIPTIDALGYWTNTYGFRAKIDSIGDEYMVTAPNSTMSLLKGVPMNVSLQISLDSITWMDLKDLMGMGNSTFYPPITMASEMGLGGNFYILDPTEFLTYSEYAAIPMQTMLSFCLFTSPLNNWDTSTTITLPLHILPPLGINILQGFDDFSFEIKWTEKGVLELIKVSYGTEILAQASLISEEPMVPGFDVLIILGLSGMTILGLIYTVRKKKLKF